MTDRAEAAFVDWWQTRAQAWGARQAFRVRLLPGDSFQLGDDDGPLVRVRRESADVLQVVMLRSSREALS